MEKLIVRLASRLALLCVAIVLAAPVYGQSTSERVLAYIVRHADLVVQAHVRSIETDRDEHQSLEQIVTLQLEEKVAGDVAEEVLVVRVPQAIYDGPAIPTFERGEKVIVCLKQVGGAWMVFFNSAGKVSITGATVEESSLSAEQFKNQIKAVAVSTTARFTLPAGFGEHDGGSGSGICKLGGEFCVIDPLRYGPVSGTIEFKINPANAVDKDDNALSFSDVKAAVQRTVDTWNDVHHSYVTFTISSSSYSGSRVENNNVSTVTFEDIPFNGRAYVLHSGGIIDEVDLIFDKKHRWNTSTTYPSSYPTHTHTRWGTIGPVDLEDIAAHEVGHGVGLDHVTSSFSSYTLYPTDYTASEWWEKTIRRSLEDGDEAGKVYMDPSLPGSSSTQQLPQILVGAPSSVDLSSSFTVGAGKTFEIDEDRTLAFASSAKLYVYGDLSVQEDAVLTRANIRSVK